MQSHLLILPLPIRPLQHVFSMPSGLPLEREKERTKKQKQKTENKREFWGRMQRKERKFNDGCVVVSPFTALLRKHSTYCTSRTNQYEGSSRPPHTAKKANNSQKTAAIHWIISILSITDEKKIQQYSNTN